MANKTPIPTEISLRQNARQLTVNFESGEQFEFTCEFLRVYSPSAEVRGHSPDQSVLQVGKADVNIKDIEPIGNYAVRLHFDDGHDSGIYSWDWLYHLGQHHDQLWQTYLEELEKAGQKRSPSTVN